MANLQFQFSQPVLGTGQYLTVNVFDSNGNNVFTGNEDNTAFTVTGLTAGQAYTIDIAGNLYCFTAPDDRVICQCPQNISASLQVIDNVLYVVFLLDLPGNTVPCEFFIYAADPNHSASQVIHAAGNLTLVSGITYTGKLYVQKIKGETIRWEVALGEPGNEASIVNCASGTLVYNG